MSTFVENYINDKRGQAFIMSLIIVVFCAILSIAVALVNPDATPIWNWFYYSDIAQGEFNFFVFFLELICFYVIFVYLAIGLSNRTELRGGSPDWLQVIIPAIISLIFGFIISNLTYQGTVIDTEVSTISVTFGNFSNEMKIALFFTNFCLIILTIIYFVFHSKSESSA